MLKWGCSPLLVFFTIVLSGSNLFSQTNSVNRDHDAIIISGEILATFDGAPLSELFLYSFNDQSQTFTQIPFQFDERGVSGTDTSFFITDDGLLDDNDELVFMASDLGDRDPANPPAVPGNWLADVISMINPRVEISATDVLGSSALSKSQGLAQGWAYLFRSSTLTKEFTQVYVTYTDPTSDANDSVQGETYNVGSANNGFLNFLAFPQNPSTNILERQKIRGTTSLFSFNEDNFSFVSVQETHGPVRVIRELVVNLLSVLEVTLPFQYFKSFVSLSGAVNIAETLPLGISITKIQHTLDLTTNATNPAMTFTNPNNSLTIDGQIDTPNTTIEKSPEFNYTHVAGNQGTIVQLFTIPANIGDSQDLFYRDELSISNEPGDGNSIGEAGLVVIGSDVEGQFPLLLKFVFSGNSEPTSLGDDLVNFEENPLMIDTLSQTFDAVVPVELTAFTAAVVGNDVSLVWITATETKNFGFDIQRKLIESDSWEKINFVKGNSTTTTPVRYEYTDENLAAGAYNYRLKQIDTNGSFEFSPIITVEVGLPKTFALNQNFPNPFNPSTTINYQISTANSSATETTLAIFNILGTQVLTLVNEEQGPGFYSVVWNGKNREGLQAPSGVYIYQLTAGRFKETKKMLFVQ